MKGKEILISLSIIYLLLQIIHKFKLLKSWQKREKKEVQKQG